MAYYSSDYIQDVAQQYLNYILLYKNVGFTNGAPLVFSTDYSSNNAGIYNPNLLISDTNRPYLKGPSLFYASTPNTGYARIMLFSIPVKVNGIPTYNVLSLIRTTTSGGSNWRLNTVLEELDGSTTHVNVGAVISSFRGTVGITPIVQEINGDTHVGCLLRYYDDPLTGHINGNPSGMISAINMRVVEEWLQEHHPDAWEIEQVDLWEEAYGEPSTEGGYTGGTFDDSSDTIAIPTAPTMGVTSAGFINVYSPTQGELVQFGSELFPDLSFTPVSQGGAPTSVTDALVAMAQVLVDFGNQIPQIIDMYINANLINYVIDCHILPIAPTTAGNAPLKVGFKTFSQTPLKVSSDYVDFDCGTLNVGEYYANFADYAPYTSAKLYLPFVGFMDIAPEYWQSGTLQVVYRFNVIDGSFVAYVKSTSSKSKLSDTVIAQFGGNACVHIPITGLNYANMVSGIVSAVSPLLPSAKSNVGTVDKLVNSANTIASAKPAMQQSNGYNATTSFLTVRFPYLLIERSVSNFSRKYDSENGIPSNITLNFATLSGFTKATMLHLDGIAGATEDDLDEIASLLAEGVIL